MGRRDSSNELSEEVMSLIESFHEEHRDDAHHVIGGRKAWFNVEFLVLLYWVTTFRISTIAKNSATKALLEEVHAGLFAVLVGLGTDESDAESYVHERYSSYYEAVASRHDSAEGLSHVAACFVGFCNEKDGYSLQFNKNTAAFQLIADFLKALNKQLD